MFILDTYLLSVVTFRKQNDEAWVLAVNLIMQLQHTLSYAALQIASAVVHLIASYIQQSLFSLENLYFQSIY